VSLLWGVLGITALCLGGFLLLISGSVLADRRRAWLQPYVAGVFFLIDIAALARAIWEHQWLHAGIAAAVLIAVVRAIIRNRRQARFLDQPRTGASA
jgi:hypothetical protein